MYNMYHITKYTMNGQTNKKANPWPRSRRQA